MRNQTVNLAASGALFCALLAFSSASQAETILLEPQFDATIYEPEGGNFPITANGKGESTFAGRTGSSPSATEGIYLRRTLTKFDLSQIPENATIQSVSLTYHFILARDRASAHENTLHLLTTPWNEGPGEPFDNGGRGVTATATDVTWIRTGIADATWSSDGGDFVATPSATAQAPQFLDNPMTFSSTQMAADVQAWIDGATPNNGWIVLGDESGEAQTARGFGSRENAAEANRPTLEVTYTLASNAEKDTWVVY